MFSQTRNAPVNDVVIKTAIWKSVDINLRRIFFISLVSVPVHALFFLAFLFSEVSTDAEALWRSGIMTIHGASAIVQSFVAFLSASKKRPSRSTPFRFTFQHVVIAIIAIMLISLVAFDQLITTNITPFILLCMGIGVAFILRPLLSVTIFGIFSIVFCIAVAIFQDDPAIVLTNRVNGVGFAVFGMSLSLIIWNIYKKSIEQEIEIERQQEELEEKNRELQRLAYLDTLTGLYNRRRWLELVEEEINLICRYDNLASIILMDLDNFKETNDQYGHPTGDAVLEEIAQLLTDNLRVVDKPCRWGGEEFIILLPQIPLGKGKAVAEKIRSVIEKSIFHIDGSEISIEASFGVASLKCKENAFKESYSRADKALYEAKRKGRNRVETEEVVEE